MSVDKIQNLRDRSKVVNEKSIRFRARYEDVRARRERKAAELKERWGVSGFKELRNLASQKLVNRNNLIADCDQKVAASEALIKEIEENEAKAKQAQQV